MRLLYSGLLGKVQEFLFRPIWGQGAPELWSNRRWAVFIAAAATILVLMAMVAVLDFQTQFLAQPTPGFIVGLALSHDWPIAFTALVFAVVLFGFGLASAQFQGALSPAGLTRNCAWAGFVIVGSCIPEGTAVSTLTYLVLFGNILVGVAGIVNEARYYRQAKPLLSKDLQDDGIDGSGL